MGRSFPRRPSRVRLRAIEGVRVRCRRASTAARVLTSSAVIGAGSIAAGAERMSAGGSWAGRARGGDQLGEGAVPGGDALAVSTAKAERERLGARVQGGMAQLLVAGIRARHRGR